MTTPQTDAYEAFDLAGALAYAETWTEHGYSPESRAYWQGMRDTLRVLTGVTTETPGLSTDDPAGFALFGPYRRTAQSAERSAP